MQTCGEILVISHFSQGEEESSNDRFHYIANMVKRKYNVFFLTSSFFHTTKRHIERQEDIEQQYVIKYISEPGYKKNICLKRFYSHFIFGRNIKMFLSNMQGNPQVIYCACPSLSVAFVACKYAKQQDIPIIIDIQDLWPEAFKMVFNPLGLGNIAYYPMKKIADYIYRNADAIITVSQTYCDRAEKTTEGVKTCLPVYIGTSFQEFDRIAIDRNDVADSTKYLIYVGTLGHSYDLKSAIDAYQIVNYKYKKDIKFLVLCDGPLENEFKNYARAKNVEVEFKGRLPYNKMVSYLKLSHIAINPIMGHSEASIINKHADYAAAGLPVVSSQESIEYSNLLNNYQAGFNCKNGDAEDMAARITELLHNEDLRLVMAKNSRKMGEDLFDRDRTYQKITQLIDSFL